MREIKFRAWSEGQMTHCPIGTNYGLHRFFGVLPDEAIIMQYTGLKNKNGVEIYEGDVIKFLLSPKELEWDSSENMFGTEPQNSWVECTKATEPIKVEAEIYYNDEGLSFSLKNFKCQVMKLDEEDYHLADPNEIGGGADGFETIIDSFYENWCDFEMDAILYNLNWSDFINIEVIGNIHENPELIQNAS